jgi:hypothetical protein
MRRPPILGAVLALAVLCALLAPPGADHATPPSGGPLDSAKLVAVVDETRDCHVGAHGAGTVVELCASLHQYNYYDQLVGAGSADHTAGPGPVTINIYAIHLEGAGRRVLATGPGEQGTGGPFFVESSRFGCAETRNSVYEYRGVMGVRVRWPDGFTKEYTIFSKPARYIACSY